MKKIGILIATSLLLVGCEVSGTGGYGDSDSTNVLGTESITEKTGPSSTGVIKTNSGTTTVSKMDGTSSSGGGASLNSSWGKPC
jgi:hypothetical protein